MILVEKVPKHRADGDKKRDEDREHNTKRLVGADVDETKDDEADELHECEKMNRSCWNSTCVVVDRVKR